MKNYFRVISVVYSSAYDFLILIGSRTFFDKSKKGRDKTLKSIRRVELGDNESPIKTLANQRKKRSIKEYFFLIQIK